MAAPTTPKTNLAQDAIKARALLEEERLASTAKLQAADRPATVPLAQGETAGAQTRGGPRLGATPAGKELIGMRSGVPIYADTAEVYGAPKTQIPGAIAADGVEVVQTPEQQRAEYQASAAPKAAAAMAQPKPATTYWSPEYAKSYDQAVARESALARVGGADEATRRKTEAVESAKFMGGVTKTFGREAARQQIAAGTATPETIAKYPELNPLRSIAKPGEGDYGKKLTETEMNRVNALLVKPKAAQTTAPRPKFASVRR
jgi:hypothetical protein